MDPNPSYEVPPVSRAFSLLRHISAGNRCRNMSKAAAALEMNRTTLLRLLHTLEREGMIERDEDGGGYILSYGLLELTASMLSSRDVVRLARPLLARLAAETGLSAHLGVLSRTDVIVLVRETPEVQLVSNIREGSRLPAHATVMGRIILAHMPRAEVRDLLADGKLAAITSRTAVTFEQLERQLDADRAEGLAWSVANYEEGIGSCAAVILDHSNRPVAAISLSGRQSAFEPNSDRRQAIADGVHSTAQRLSSLLGAQV
ncbi:IclR family transcriptional regulator [Paracoccus pantotrophus]|uniref:IclR family transcriptional regulator n=1 Tax=Paracoccus pantotrophus TaxID=82367 RepID=UPI00215D611D|nr:IclR family transcriptional regulator [Paracoccus pantotrophus]